MKMNIGGEGPAVRRRQIILMVAGVSLLIGILVMMTVFSSSSSKETSSRYTVPFTSGSSRIKPQDIWVEKFTTDHDLTTKRLEAMETMLATLITLNTAKPKEPEPMPPSENRLPRDEVPELRSDLKTVVQKDVITPAPPLGPSSLKEISPPRKTSFRPHTKGIHRTSLALVNTKGHRSLKTNDTTIPAGTFAQAVLLGGVDASTSLQSANDPRPVLLRITHPGTLPRTLTSDLTGCHVLAACYGDLSSERVYMRLEKLTCTERRTGEILEMTLQGYVAGEDGRAGLRGTVVDRAGESVRNVAVGGFLSGIGSFLSASSSPTTYSLTSGLAQTNPLTHGEMLKQGVGKGATSALDKYADFYIKRAEQMQPVIQVQAGRRVDIVITQGVAFEDSAAKGARVRAHDAQRYAQIHREIEPLKPIDAWIPEKGETAHD